MTNGVSIKYGDVAPEAKENFDIAVTDAESFFDKTQLQKYNVNFPNYANPCELYSVALDGTASAFPSVPENANLGMWSDQLSNADGTFTEPIVLTLTSAGQYSSQGITFTFDKYNDIYCNSLNIKWYRVTTDGIEQLGDVNFTPDSSSYFCRNQVENYNKVVITFNSINMPYNRLKLRVIDYGYGTMFYGDELRSVKCIQEIDPITRTIPINPVDFTLDSKSDMIYSFQAKQPLNVFFNDKLIQTMFVDNSKRKAEKLWSVQTEDYIGIMDSIAFVGGIYVDKDAIELLTEIFTAAKVPFEISDVFIGKKVSGYIPYTSCREALTHVAFAIGACVDTSNSECVKVFKLADKVSQTIPLSRIMQGQSFEDNKTVTAVELAYHTYKAINETLEVYDAAESGTGSDILVRFSEPLHSLSITNGTITQSGTNYAVINANSGCILQGKKYEHTTTIKRKSNPVVLASEIENIESITDKTLISSANVDDILNNCYDYLTNVSQTNLKIVEGKHIIETPGAIFGMVKFGEVKFGQKAAKATTYDDTVNVGDNISAKTHYMGDVSGRIIKETFSLNGGILIKEAVMK